MKPSQIARLVMNSSEFPLHHLCPSVVLILCNCDLEGAVGSGNYKYEQWPEVYICVVIAMASLLEKGIPLFPRL